MRVGLFVFVLFLCAFSAEARRGVEPVFAQSDHDPALINSLMALGPGIDPEEARQVAGVAYNTGRELRKEWRIAYPPGYHHFLMRIGKRKAGMCFQFATELLLRLDALKLKTLELHWAESFNGSASEHNVIVVTAIGGSFANGIILDNWRYGGRLVWGRANTDPHYEWTENRAEMIYRLQTRSIAPHERATAAHKAK